MPRVVVRGAVDVIATVIEADCGGGRMGSGHPIAWCHARQRGRSWYTGVGHERAVSADEVFGRHLQRGLRHVARLSDAC